jgi:hypothetical protein
MQNVWEAGPLLSTLLDNWDNTDQNTIDVHQFRCFFLKILHDIHAGTVYVSPPCRGEMRSAMILMYRKKHGSWLSTTALFSLWNIMV